MCNAYQHPDDCDCGFGGYTYGGSGAEASPVGSVWQFRDEDFCRPTSCPECGAEVFFVRHNGGSVWFDDLGPPWPKHGCFDDGGGELRSGLREASSNGSPGVFGVVVEAFAISPGDWGRIRIRSSDGTVMDEYFRTALDLTQIPGQLVVMRRDGGKLRLVPVHGPHHVMRWFCKTCGEWKVTVASMADGHDVAVCEFGHEQPVEPEKL